MNDAKRCGFRRLWSWRGAFSFELILLMWLAMLPAMSAGQDAPAKTGDPDDSEGTVAAVSMSATPEERIAEAWTLLSNAARDLKHPQTRIQALAAVGLMRNARSEKTISDAMGDADLDIRTAAVLAVGEAKDRNLTTDVRNLLDDKEPQVAFTAAMTLWKMGDRSGEDILMAVLDGERKAGPTLMHGTEHDISKELHDPAAMAKLGAMQGASMLLGPFGYGITAYEYIRKNGGDSARVSAIEQISQEKTAPVHKELVAALGDKDPTVRAAAAKALVDYRDNATSMAIYALFADTKQPVRLTAAAAYLRTTGVPGPPPAGTPERAASAPQSAGAKH
jgi:HEAT repeat protein